MRISHVPPEQARELLQAALALGVNLIDTADSYGEGESERFIAEALHPYPEELVIATKGGQILVDGLARPNGRPEHLRRACEESLRRLLLERIDLYQLHSPDPDVPLEESLGALEELRQEGKVRMIGVSNVFREGLEAALAAAPLVSVQNELSLTNRFSEPELATCQERGLAFLPYLPLAAGALTRADGELERIAGAHAATPAQVALAWLLARSPCIVAIPGTCSKEHLEANARAATIALSGEELDRLTTAAGAPEAS
jgi:pyridoxine 4-dehydrogenase